MNIKKFLISASASAIMLAAVVIPAFGANNGTDQIGPLAGSSTDNGTCGPWATDTYNLFFKIHDNGDGTFAVRTEYKDGTFVTLGGGSPGCAGSTSHHGSTVDADIRGDFQGWVDETVTSTSYDPDVCITTPAACTTRTDAIAAMFGPTYSEDFEGWNFEYNSSDKSLSFHHWQDKSSKTLGEQFIGDIANE